MNGHRTKMFLAFLIKFLKKIRKSMLSSGSSGALNMKFFDAAEI